ncbi:MAG: hypothetical protein Q9177_003959 [Variospora cf. flavescens]
MVLKCRIRIFGIRIPKGRSHNLVTNIRVNDLEPARVGIGAELSNQAVAQLDEAGGAGVMAKQSPQAVLGHSVAFADALDQIVELDIGGNAAELERHRWQKEDSADDYFHLTTSTSSPFCPDPLAAITSLDLTCDSSSSIEAWLEDICQESSKSSALPSSNPSKHKLSSEDGVLIQAPLEWQNVYRHIASMDSNNTSK